MINNIISCPHANNHKINDQLTNDQLKVFDYEGKKVRSFIDEEGEPWFVASDISSLLGYRAASDATRILDADEKGLGTVLTPGGPQKLAIFNESGLYSLIFLSRKPEVKNFKKWVTSKVLPSIRKTGSYGQQIDLQDPKQLRRLLQDYATKIEINQPKVEFYDKYVNSEGLYNLQNAARALNKHPNLFINSLKNTYLFYQGTALVPYQKYLEQGLFEVKSTIIENRVCYQSYITPKGLEHFAKNSLSLFKNSVIKEVSEYEN